MQTGSLLFNYEFAKEHIKDSKTAILVESPLNAIRLAEADILNGVALFGVNFSTQKQLLLDQLSVTDLILLMDNDEAGKKAARKITEECSNYYNIRQLKLSDVNDVADLTIEQVKKLL